MVPFVIIEDAHGKQIRVEVSEAVAIYITEDDRYIDSLHDNDQRYFQLVHFDKPAWENVRGLSAGRSTEDYYLGMSEEIEEAERAFYFERLALCRRLLPLVREACTPIQWRRFLLHSYYGKTTREIAKMEGCHQRAVWKSVNSVQKKIDKIFANLQFRP